MIVIHNNLQHLNFRAPNHIYLLYGRGEEIAACMCSVCVCVCITYGTVLVPYLAYRTRQQTRRLLICNGNATHIHTHSLVYYGSQGPMYHNITQAKITEKKDEAKKNNNNNNEIFERHCINITVLWVWKIDFNLNNGKKRAARVCVWERERGAANLNLDNFYFC